MTDFFFVKLHFETKVVNVLVKDISHVACSVMLMRS